MKPWQLGIDGSHFASNEPKQEPSFDEFGKDSKRNCKHKRKVCNLFGILVVRVAFFSECTDMCVIFFCRHLPLQLRHRPSLCYVKA